MRMILWLSLLFLLVVPGMLPAADKLQESVDSLASRDTSTYEKAVSYLSKHPREAAYPLQKLLTDYGKPPLARLRASMLLGDFGDTSAVESLKNALFSGMETNGAVRGEIIGSLGRLGHEDIVADYYNSGSEKLPSVIAAVAQALEGSTDDKSKLALAHLLVSSDNERVAKATVLAIEGSYKSALSSQTDATGQKFDFAKLLVEAENQVKNTEHPDYALFHPPPDAHTSWMSPTAGDEAIFEALKSKVKVSESNPNIDKDVLALLLVLSKAYKQTGNP